MLASVPLITYRSQLAGWLAFAALASCLVAGSAGAWLGYRYGVEAGNAKVAQLRADQAVSHSDSVKRAAARYATQAAREAALAEQLQISQAALAHSRQPRVWRIDRVSTQYQPAPGMASVAAPRCVLTRGWVRDYNAAFGLSDGRSTTAPNHLGDAGSQASAADGGLLADDLQDSGVSLADLRAHTEDVAAWCRSTEAQRDALIHARRVEGETFGHPLDSNDDRTDKP